MKKKIIFSLLLTQKLLLLAAQSSPEDLSYVDKVPAKREANPSGVMMSPLQEKIYSEYCGEIKRLDKKVNDIAAMHKAGSSAGSVDKISRKLINLGVARQKLERKYYKKIRKAGSPLEALEIVQGHGDVPGKKISFSVIR